MKLDAVTRQPGGGGFGGRFYLVGYLPTCAAILFLLFLIRAGARGWAGPGGHISFKAAVATASHLSLSDIVMLVLGITLLAVVVSPLQTALVRMAEERWPTVLGTAWALKRQRRRKNRLLRAAQLPTGSALTDAAVQQAGAASYRLRRRFPIPDHLLQPTTLGNVLAAMEDTAGRAYGLDAVTAWPRLYPVLGEAVKSLVDDRRDAMDAEVRMAATMAFTALVALVLLLRSGWWMLLALFPLALAVLAYNGAVQAALAYAETVQVAFDLHRADLLRALRMDPPTRQETERVLNEHWCDHWRQGVPLPSDLEFTPDENGDTSKAGKAEKPNT
jgi:hypothetical protein